MQEEVATAEKEWERQCLKVPHSFATHLVGVNESLGPVTQPIPNGIVFAVDNGPEKEEGDGLRRRRVYTAVIALCLPPLSRIQFSQGTKNKGQCECDRNTENG